MEKSKIILFDNWQPSTDHHVTSNQIRAYPPYLAYGQFAWSLCTLLACEVHDLFNLLIQHTAFPCRGGRPTTAWCDYQYWHYHLYSFFWNKKFPCQTNKLSIDIYEIAPSFPVSISPVMTLCVRLFIHMKRLDGNLVIDSQTFTTQNKNTLLLPHFSAAATQPLTLWGQWPRQTLPSHSSLQHFSPNTS